MEFKDELKRRSELVEQDLEFYFDRKFDAPDIIVSAMKYSLFAGGKRLRPILTKAVCEMLGGDERAVAPLAAALEMIHTYSLIHDDMPAMDNDDYRRGKPTNHKVYGEDMAILAGDALLNYAMEVAIGGVPEGTPADAFAYLKAMSVIFHASGVDGMVGGQTADIINEGEEIDEAQLLYIHAHKTGALLKAAVLAGAYAAKADDDTLDALALYAEKIGLAFQVVDDILDVEGDEADLGKPVGSDKKNEKTTFVTLYGIASSKEKVADLKKEALSALSVIERDTSFLEEIAVYICNRSK